MGLTLWHLMTFCWDACPSKRDKTIAHPLSEEAKSQTPGNAYSYDQWKCIFHWLLTNPEVFGAFTEMFGWNNCEMLLRIGRHYPDMFALTAEGPFEVVSERLANLVYIRLPIKKPDTMDLLDYELFAACRKIDTDKPNRKHKKRAPRLDLGLIAGHEHRDYDNLDSDPDSIEEIDSPPPSNLKIPPAKTNAVFRKSPSRSPPMIAPIDRNESPMFSESGSGAMLGSKIDELLKAAANNSDVLASAGPPTPKVDASSDSGIIA